MTVEQVLREAASMMAARLGQRDAAAAHARRLSYRSRLGHVLQCPSCWVAEQSNASLRALPGDAHHDFLKCNRCGMEYEVPLD